MWTPRPPSAQPVVLLLSLASEITTTPLALVNYSCVATEQSDDPALDLLVLLLEEPDLDARLALEEAEDGVDGLGHDPLHLGGRHDGLGCCLRSPSPTSLDLQGPRQRTWMEIPRGRARRAGAGHIARRRRTEPPHPCRRRPRSDQTG